ncbi:transcriptional regulator, TetR family [Hymenobacter daecheongensis DSM 21074]|uniref:Transcriptional regulator, TetR family n=1 Tax=Hymenobacter daecheongensis DSM 21074 TaxID=1121955 RepID=A0A1M6A812_9BACT|nr:TetR/AcrR family transcriptional regulator [Hymenobacter daecheongensis]SHI32591.1 transcriptional regulator, TetR family [Hymenobacter daecheongensis DSM 21074]
MEIKDRILQAALGLFGRNGIRSVSMDDIATQLGISKKTLYKWFENKDQIVHGVMQQHLAQTQGDCETMAGQSESAVAELVKMMSWMKSQFADIHPSIFHDLQKYHPATWQLWLEHKNEFILDQIVDNLRRGMAEGLYRADLDVDVLARLRLAEIELAFNPTVFSPRQFDPQRVALVTLEHFMLGVATLKGHKLINAFRHVTEEE